jgi:hypothetical protein
MMVEPTGISYDSLKDSMESLLAESPNAAEFMHKYRNKDSKDDITKVVVKWSSFGRDSNFPKETILTQDNYQAVLALMAASNGKDVLAVTLKKAE